MKREPTNNPPTDAEIERVLHETMESAKKMTDSEFMEFQRVAPVAFKCAGFDDEIIGILNQTVLQSRNIPLN